MDECDEPLYDEDLTGELCVFCGCPEWFSLTDYSWSQRWFEVAGCCEGLRLEAISWLEGLDRRSFVEWFRSKTGDEPRGMTHEADGDAQPWLLDWGLRVEPVTLREAREFVARVHVHLPKAPPGWKYGAAAWNGPTLIGVIMVGRPAARKTAELGTTLEVTRLAIDRDQPKQLRWNAASLLYGEAAREAKRRGYEWIQTFTLAEEETGASLKASGWEEVARTSGGSWKREGRTSEARPGVTEGAKVKWRRKLKKKPTGTPAPEELEARERKAKAREAESAQLTMFARNPRPEDQQVILDAGLVGMGRKPIPWGPREIQTIEGVTVYASGAGAPADIQGLADVGFDVGLSAAECRGDCEAAALSLGPDVKVFVDSGAFSEVVFGPSGPTWPRPITRDRWRSILDLYERMASQIGPRLAFVAPDRVASQPGTLKRLRAHRLRVLHLVSMGAIPIVALQLGPASTAAFYDAAADILGVPFCVGIPSKKAATPTPEVEAFLRARGKALAGVHFLGLGPENPRCDELVELCRRYAPQALVSQDAVILRSLVGWDQPRPVTAAGLIAREQLEPLVLDNELQYSRTWDPGIGWGIVGDFWEERESFEGDLGTQERFRIAREAGLDGEEAQAYSIDPELYRSRYHEPPWLDEIVKSRWADSIRPGLAAARRLYSIQLAVRRVERPLKLKAQQGVLF